MTNRDTHPTDTPQPSLRGYLEHFRRRVLYQALLEGTANHWEHVAATYENAAPHADDYPGQATEHDLDQAAHRCAQTAAACRNKATILRETALDAEALAVIEDILDHPREVA